MKKTLLILVLILSTPVQTLPNENSDWTKDLLVYAYLPHPAETLARIESYIMGSFQKSPSQIAQGLLLSTLLKNTKLESLDLSKGLIYLRADPRTSSNPFLYAVHLKDKDLFLLGFGKEPLGGKGFILKEETRNRPILEFTDEKVQFDRSGYLKALEKGSADPRQFQKTTIIPYFVSFRDTRVIVSGTKELLQKFMANPTLPFPLNQENDLVLTLRPTLIYKAYQAEIRSGREKIRPILLTYADLLLLADLVEKLLSEIHFVEVGFGFSGAEEAYLNIRFPPVSKALIIFPLVLSALHETGNLRSFCLLPQYQILAFHCSVGQDTTVIGYGFFQSLNIRVSNLTPTPVAPLQR